MTEHWVPVIGFETLYAVSDHGRVRSVRNGRVMSPGSGQDGYPIISLYKAGVRKGIAVHRLVAEHFVTGRNPLHKEVAHLDGDRANARAENLKWVSRGENISHKLLHGTHQVGENHPRARLTEADVAEIRGTRGLRSAIAVKFGISVHTVTDIRIGKRWSHVSLGEDASND